MGSPKCILQHPSKQTKPRGKYSLKECEIYFTLKKLLSFGFGMLFALTGIGLLAQLFKICNICDKIMRVPEKINSLNFVIKSWKSPWIKANESFMNHDTENNKFSMVYS